MPDHCTSRKKRKRTKQKVRAAAAAAGPGGSGTKNRKKLPVEEVVTVADLPEESPRPAADSVSRLKREKIPVFVGSSQNVVMMERGDPRPDGEVWNKYRKQVKESGGFDIDVYPGPSLWASLIPINITSPCWRDDLTLAAKLALFYYNRSPTPKRDSRYEFSRVVKANHRIVSGLKMYITFEATKRGSYDNPSPAVKTFQALVWKCASCKLVVQFCRLKNEPEPPYSGDKVASEVHLPSSCVGGHCYP